MIKLQTPVQDSPCSVGISYKDKILLLGSCFADNIGRAMADYGFDSLANPFGTLYNPASVRSAICRLALGEEFVPADCVPLGAGSDKVCSFSHHTSFAREEEAAFLENANSALRSASAFFRDCSKIIISLGTAWCFRYTGTEKSRAEIDPKHEGEIVSNCLKRDGKEFLRLRLSPADCAAILGDIASLCNGSERRKDIIFTVSPIRHLADGAHGNQLSKSTLLMAIDQTLSRTGSLPNGAGNDPSAGNCDYFPAYEIMMDELRDYRFYAEDMVHPSSQAAGYIAERFFARHLAAADKAALEQRIREHKQRLHQPLIP